MRQVLWSAAEVELLRQHYPDTLTEKLLPMFPGRTKFQIYNKADGLKIKKTEAFIKSPEGGRMQIGDTRGNEYQWKKGQKAWNDGISVNIPGLEKTQFKKGNLPWCTKEDGAITIRKDRRDRPTKFIRISRSKWVAYQRWIWQQAYGAIPHGYNIEFIDGDAMNCELSNLRMASRKQSAIRMLTSPDHALRLLSGYDKDKEDLFRNETELIELKQKQMQLQITINTIENEK